MNPPEVGIVSSFIVSSLYNLLYTSYKLPYNLSISFINFKLPKSLLDRVLVLTFLNKIFPKLTFSNKIWSLGEIILFEE